MAFIPTFGAFSTCFGVVSALTLFASSSHHSALWMALALSCSLRALCFRRTALHLHAGIAKPRRRHKAKRHGFHTHTHHTHIGSISVHCVSLFFRVCVCFRGQTRRNREIDVWSFELPAVDPLQRQHPWKGPTCAARQVQCSGPPASTSKTAANAP